MSNFIKISDNWNTLSESEKIAIFEQASYNAPTIEQLKATFGDEPFKIISYYAEPTDDAGQDIIVTAIPKPEFVEANELIFIDNKNNIESVKVNAITEEDSSFVKLLVTIDLLTYKTFYEGEWITVDINNTQQILNIGLTIEAIENISTEQWAALTNKFSDFDHIAFGYILDKDISSAECELADITVNLIDGIEGELTDFKFILVGYSPDGKYKFVANKNIQKNISWEALNEEELCTTSGRDMSYSKTSPTIILRLPHSAQDTNSDGEWDAIIVDEGGPINGNDIEYWNTSTKSWMLNTPIQNDDLDIAPINTMRIARGGDSIDSFTSILSSTTSPDVGYRPIMLVGEKQEEAPYTPPLNLSKITNIANSVPGNVITCEYFASNQGEVGRFFNLGRATKDLINDKPGDTPNGTFGFVHVGYTPSGAYKFIADRNIQGSISWETLNEAGYCTTSGVDAEYLTGIKGSYIRLIQSYVSNKTMDKSSSEWDTIMRKNTIGATGIPFDWNIYKSRSWTLNTPSENDDVGTVAINTSRIARGCEANDDSTTTRCIYDSNDVYAGVCFRPVLIVPMDKQSAICDIVVTPTYVNHHNVAIEAHITPFKDDIDITKCTVRIIMNSETILEREFLPGYNFKTIIPNDCFSNGNNEFTVIFTVDDIDNEYDIVVTKEVLHDIVKIRDFQDYTGGFLLSNNTIDDDGNIVSNTAKQKINNKENPIIIPNNTIKIELVEN